MTSLDEGFEGFQGPATGAHITPEAVMRALDGFPLQARKSVDWLAGEVRSTFVCAILSEEDIDDQPASAVIHAELYAIADALKAAISRFQERSDWAEGVLRSFAKNNKGWREMVTDLDLRFVPIERLDDLEAGKGDWWVKESIARAQISDDWHDFRHSISGVISAEEYIRQAADQICKPQPPRWRSAMKRPGRVSFAIELSGVFEEAYGRSATVNNWPDGSGRPKGGHWADFFGRVARLALRVDHIPDLLGLLKEARKTRLANQG